LGDETRQGRRFTSHKALVYSSRRLRTPARDVWLTSCWAFEALLTASTRDGGAEPSARADGAAARAAPDCPAAAAARDRRKLPRRGHAIPTVAALLAALQRWLQGGCSVFLPFPPLRAVLTRQRAVRRARQRAARPTHPEPQARPIAACRTRSAAATSASSARQPRARSGPCGQRSHARHGVRFHVPQVPTAWRSPAELDGDLLTQRCVCGDSVRASPSD
jgi:hypothetical protein